MKHFLSEVSGNYDGFRGAWRSELSDVMVELESSEDVFAESYRRLTSLQAWRSELLEQLLSEPSLSFFMEAQNDALTSHVQAAMGLWRTSLKSLRSCIENVINCIYYQDHPVEYRLWEDGKHRMGFTDLVRYLQSHPDISNYLPSDSGIDEIRSEYATLSRAVHGTGRTFRMTANGHSVSLMTSERSRLGGWRTREKAVISAVNVLLIALFKEHLTGHRLPNLRKPLSVAITPGRHATIRRLFAVALYKMPPS